MAEQETDMALFGKTFTVTERMSEPLAPLQVRVYVRSEIKFPVDSVPLSPLEPDQAPEAVQVVALVEDQVRLLAVL